MQSRKRYPNQEAIEEDLIRQIRLIFDEQSGQYAIKALDQIDLFAKGITGLRNADLWRIWRDSWQLFSMSRPYEAQHRLSDAYVLHSSEPGEISLVDLELYSVNALCLTICYQPADAINSWDEVLQGLERFSNMIHDEPAKAASEIRVMLHYLIGIENSNEVIDDKHVIESWLIGRGVVLLLKIYENIVNIIDQYGNEADEAYIANDIRKQLEHFCDRTGLELSLPLQIDVEFTIGNILTLVDPEKALQCFKFVSNFTDFESETRFVALFNYANCLLSLHRYKEAADIYEDIESFFEHIGDPSMAARVWMAGDLARWKQTGDLSIRYHLRGAIEFYEDNLPEEADYNTKFSLKRYIEIGYQLMARLLAEVKHPTDEDLDDLIGILWALFSRDIMANLSHSQVEKPEEVDWDTVLDQQTKLSMIKNIMVSYPGTAVIHLLCLPDRLKKSEAHHLPPKRNVHGMVWFLYGFDQAGNFQFESSIMPVHEAHQIYRFISLMNDQLTADTSQDTARVQRIQDELIQLGDYLGGLFSPAFREALTGMSDLFYMPHPYQNADEFPIQCLRFDNGWLGAKCSITRASTINHFQELLSANNRRVRPNSKAVVVLGNPEVAVNQLLDADAEANRVELYAQHLGFETTQHNNSTCSEMFDWLSGGAGLVHYIGHGLSNTAYEGLPLGDDEFFNSIDLAPLNPARTPFVFLCACEAGRVRYGTGGYQTGLASRLLEKGAPGVLAFNMPIPEGRAYRIAREFYRQSSKYPFGKAVCEVRARLSQEIPAYAWLALTAYGDPDFILPSVSTASIVPSISDHARTWATSLSAYASLRTSKTLDVALEMVCSAPEPYKKIAQKLLEVGFKDPPASSKKVLTRLEREALKAETSNRVDSLILRSVIIFEQAHLFGLDQTPMSPKIEENDFIDIYQKLNFVASVGYTVNDLPLNGVACALLGRLLTWGLRNLEKSEKYLQHSYNVMRCYENVSPFMDRMRKDSANLIHQFGGEVEGL